MWIIGFVRKFEMTLKTMKGFRDLEGTVLVQSSAFPPVLRFHDSRVFAPLPLTILVENILAGVRGAAMSPP